MVSGLLSALARAKELADKRRHAPSTAHVLVALFRSDAQVRTLCHGQGLSEIQLMALLGHEHDERTNAIDLALERARKQAAAMGMADVSALQLVLAMTREPRSAASVELTRIGVSPEQLGQAALVALQAPLMAAPAQPGLAGRAEQHGARTRRSEIGSLTAQPRLLQRHRRVQHGRSRASLAEETESKLQRRGSSPPPADTPSLPDRAHPPVPDAPGPAPLSNLLPPVPPERTPRESASPPRQPPAEPVLTSGQPAAPTRAAKSRARVLALAQRSQAQRTRVPESPDQAYQLDSERFPLLSSIGRNLTLLAATGEIDPVIGRDADIQRVLDVLARRRGNNPVLVGSPGVGKTAIAHGLALALVASARADGSTPQLLLEISTSSLLSGTGVRGALSERLQMLRREVADASGRVLLFVDEIHTVLGGGEADSVGNELKTALARGELPMLGATTDAEYRRVFERDAALARRFTRIEVSEPSLADAVEMLRAIAPQYEAHHRVRYAPAALTAAVELSVRYLPLRQLPDKAIALMDQAGARARRHGIGTVDLAEVAGVVSELATVPIDRLLMRDAEALLALEQHLSERVVGQTTAIGSIANALRKSAAGFRGGRPLGTFLFLGPTGVGKTEMAKAISDLLFPGTPFTRIDMSELGQAHAVARLLGAPPGYIGHEDGGQLTESVRNRPYQLLLLDEIEKAHMDVLLSLLPLLDEGRLTDGRGRTVDFTNTVIVMTSNLGAECAVARPRIGFGGAVSDAGDGASERALAALRAALPPELYNRIDEPLFFTPLSELHVAEIAQRMLAGVVNVSRQRHQVEIEIDPSAIAALIAAGGFDRVLGARPMRRTIGRLVEAPLARALLARELLPGAHVVLHGHEGTIEITPKSSLARAAR